MERAGGALRRPEVKQERQELQQGPSANPPTGEANWGSGQAWRAASLALGGTEHRLPSSGPGASRSLQPVDEVRGAGPALRLLRSARERAARCSRHLCPCRPTIASPPASTTREGLVLRLGAAGGLASEEVPGPTQQPGCRVGGRLGGMSPDDIPTGC